MDGGDWLDYQSVFISYFQSNPESGTEPEPESESESESIRSPESESESEQPHHDPAPLVSDIDDVHHPTKE